MGVGCAYVAGLAALSLLWVDPASNHVIVVAEGIPQVAAVLIELAFLVAVVAAAVAVARSARGGSREELMGGTRALLATTCLYAAYVAAWDISLYVTAIAPLTSIKPFDGVLVYGAAVAGIVAAALRRTHVEEEDEPPALQPVDIAAFATGHGLTAREREVLEKYLEVRDIKACAGELFISPGTVKTHLIHIYAKTGVGGYQELLRLCDHASA